MPTILIGSAEDLRAVVRQARLPLDSKVSISLPSVPADAKRWEDRLNVLMHECGCRFGASFMLVSLILALWLRIHWFGLSLNHITMFLLSTLGELIVSGLSGKAFGILLAKYQLKRTVNEVYKWLPRGHAAPS